MLVILVLRFYDDDDDSNNDTDNDVGHKHSHHYLMTTIQLYVAATCNFLDTTGRLFSG